MRRHSLLRWAFLLGPAAGLLLFVGLWALGGSTTGTGTGAGHGPIASVAGPSAVVDPRPFQPAPSRVVDPRPSQPAPSGVVDPSQSATRPADTPAHVKRSDSYGNLPLSFEANRGQTDPSVRFLARGDGYGLFLTPTEAVLSLRAPAQRERSAADRSAIRGGASEEPRHTAVVRMRLAGAKERPHITGLDQQPGTSNYFIGKDPERWQRDVPNYARVEYAQVYPGIDLIYYGNQRQLEYDFVVAPGADPGAIALTFDGARSIATDATGNLVLTTADGQLQLQKPTIYQLADGVRHEVAGNFALQESGTVRFDVSAYDVTAPLVIDPVLVYSSYLGGTGQDIGNGIAVDAAGSAYVVGDAGAATFPTVGSNQLFSGADIFISKFTRPDRR